MSEPSVEATSAVTAVQGLAARIRSYYGKLSGLTLERMQPSEAWTSLPYLPVFVGDSETGVLHGGVVTALLDETAGLSVQLALDKPTVIATLDLRIDYQRPATPGVALQCHSHCYRVTRSIAFIRAEAYQESEADPVATATGCFMIASSHADMTKAGRSAFQDVVPLEAPEVPGSPFANSPFSRCLGIQVLGDGTTIMPFARHLIGNPVLPALHGGLIGAFLETTAIYGVRRTLDVETQPKPIGLTVNYLRSGRPVDTYGNVSIVKHGRRVVAFEAKAWQEDPAKPIASAFGHFMLRRVPEAEEV